MPSGQSKYKRMKILSFQLRPQAQLLAIRRTLQSVCVATLLGLSVSAMAAPANPKPFVHTQPDGTQVVLTLVGDEHAHLYLDALGQAVEIGDDGYVHLVAKEGRALLASRRTSALKARAEMARQVPMCIQPTATQGEVHGLIILVNFSDLKFQNTQSYIHDQMNVENFSSNGATGSARDYFVAQSSGAFRPVFDVVGPVDLDMPYRYYGGNDASGNDRHPDVMIFSAVQQAVEAGLDLNQYDRDGDGIVDMVYVIYAGLGEADRGDPNTIWPHMSNLQGSAQFAYQQIDGKRVGLYACSAEFRGDNTFSGIGTFCHEYGHCLGLPDIYDVDYSGGYGMGSYDIMSHGSYLNNGNTPPSYSAFERYSVGWLTYDDVTSSCDVSLRPLAETNRAVRLSSRANPNEYFVIENRQLVGWDAYLPARGLMITHIDYDEEVWNHNRVNDDPAHQCVMMMAADNVWNSSTQSGDLYPGLLNNTVFSDTSVPNSNLWDGSPLGKNVSEIAMTGDEVSFHVEVDLTGVRTVQSPNATASTVRYNPMGQPVSIDYRGIAIQSGRKVVSIGRLAE